MSDFNREQVKNEKPGGKTSELRKQVVPSMDQLTRRRRDPWRHDKRVLMRVHVRPMRQAIAGALVPQGEHLVEVPESMVKMVEGMVEDREDLYEQAKETFAQREADFKAERGQTAKIPDSPEAIFSANAHRDLKPLRSAEVIESGLEPPLDADDERMAAIYAHVEEAMQRKRKARDEQQGGGKGKHKH